MEETKTYEEFKEKVMEQPFYGSDEEAYIDDEDEDGEDGQYENDERDDFSLSDTGAQEFIEDDIEIDELDQDDEEERERQFFGHDQYTIMSSVPEEAEEEEKVAMSMTMQQRESKEKRERVESLRREIDQL